MIHTFFDPSVESQVRIISKSYNFLFGTTITPSFFSSNSHFFSGQSWHASSSSLVLYLWLGARRPTTTPPRTNGTGMPNPTTMPESQQRLTPPTPPRPSPPHQQWPSPPPPPQVDGGWDYIPEQVGRSVYDYLKILDLGLGAPKREIILAYQRLACLYHPDKWDQAWATTGMTLQETTEHFQLLNNAHAFLRANL
jgi:hypothetical protein